MPSNTEDTEDTEATEATEATEEPPRVCAPPWFSVSSVLNHTMNRLIPSLSRFTLKLKSSPFAKPPSRRYVSTCAS
jgi:hypothetical protein